jgi:hypothetical protein
VSSAGHNVGIRAPDHRDARGVAELNQIRLLARIV